MKKQHIFICVLCAATLIACQPSEEQRAAILVSDAQTLVDSGQWRQARIVLDSLHVTYPKQVAQRRLAKALEDSITYLEAQRTLAYTDTLLPPLLEQVDQLIKRFKYEKNAKYEDHGKYVHRDTGVHCHAIHPCLNLTLITKFLKALPQMNQCLLKEIIYLILVFGEHIADTVYRALLLLDQGRKFFFGLFHIFRLFFMLTCREFLTTFAH